MKSLNLLLVAACISLFSLLTFSGAVSALEQNEAFAAVYWVTQPQQGKTAAVSIYFQNNCSDQLTIYYIGFHFDWMPQNNYTGFDLSSNPISVISNGSHTFNPMTISIPSNVTVGSHSYTIGIDGIRGMSDSFSWDSLPYPLQIQSSGVTGFNQLKTQVSSNIEDAVNASFRSGEAQNLLSQAQEKYNTALSLANEEKWTEAVSALQTAQDYVEQAWAKEEAFSEVSSQIPWLILVGVAIVIPVVILVAIIMVLRNRKKKTPSQPPVTQEIVKPESSGGTVTARLENLKRLLDKDLITKEEYEKRKSEILAEV